MSARRTKAWTCEGCSSPTGMDPDDKRYCQTCTAFECDVCDEYGMGRDHTWHCAWCSFVADTDDPRSATEPTLHEKCIGRREWQEQCERERRERSLRMMADRPCAMVATGDCRGVGYSHGADPAIDALGWFRQEDGRDLCGYHDHSENAERRAAEAEARTAYDALPKELYCPTCDTVVDPTDVDDEPWYHCEGCDEEFNRDATENYDHRCPSCNKFASRSDTKHCADCQEDLEVRVAEEVSV